MPADIVISAPTPSFLFINVCRIGDTLFVTPAMRAVAAAHPGCHITALAHPKRAEVLRGLPFVTQVGAISKKTSPWRGWSRIRRYDFAFVYGFDATFVSYALRVADHVVAFRQKQLRINRRLYRCIEPPEFQSEHAVLQRLRLPGALGIPPAGLRLAYSVTPDELAAAHARLAGDLPPDSGPLIGLQAASFPTKSYRDWPIEYFAQLAEQVHGQWPHAHFLIYGGREERPRLHWLKDRLKDKSTLYAGRLRLRETAALMSLTDLYVGVDTGPTHIMSAFDIPLVGLYHCLSSSRLTGPLEHPCLYALDHPRLGGTCNGQTPMAEISVESVLEQIRRALREHPPATADRRFA